MSNAERKGRGLRRTRAQWSALIAQYNDSALTQTAFCDARGLAISSFTRALRRERNAHSDIRHADAFVPVLMDGARQHGESSAWDVELTLGTGVVLRIRGA